jgi:hypothetical protein
VFRATFPLEEITDIFLDALKTGILWSHLARGDSCMITRQYVILLPAELQILAEKYAKVEGISIHSFIESAISEHINSVATKKAVSKVS